MIDSVDVSGCKTLDKNLRCCGYIKCEGETCSFKFKLLKEQLAFKTEDYAELEQRHNDAYKQFQALKAQYDAVVEQNRQLQEELKCERGIKPTSAKAAKYYKALEEIKEICSDDLSFGLVGMKFEEIEQICDEVINE